MYKKSARFVQRSGIMVKKDKPGRRKKPRRHIPLLACEKCLNPVTRMSIGEKCFCGGMLFRVSGLKFFGRPKNDLVLQFRKRMGLVGHEKRDENQINKIAMNPVDIYIEILPKGYWSMRLLKTGMPKKITVRLTHIPTRITVKRTLDGKRYYGDGYNWQYENRKLCEVLCSTLENKFLSKAKGIKS